MNQNTPLQSASSTTTKIQFFDQLGVVAKDGSVNTGTRSRSAMEVIEYPEIAGGITPSELIAQLTAEDPQFEPDLRDARKRLAQQATTLLPPIKALRLRLGLSQTELANRMECSQPNIARMESSRGSDMQVSTLKRLAQALEIDPMELFALVAGES